jgi:hypothetical protein
MRGFRDARLGLRWPRLDWPVHARRAVAASFLALLTVLLLAPASAFEDVDRLFPHQDKFIHVAVFLTLALLVRWALPGERARRGVESAAIAALVLYAASVEALQPALTSGQRLFEWADLASNGAGLLAGWQLFKATLAARHPGGR